MGIFVRMDTPGDGQSARRSLRDQSNMSKKPVRSSSRLETLPPELLVSVMSLCDNASTLKSLIKSSRTIYDNFLASKRVILSAVVLQQLRSCYGQLRDPLFVLQLEKINSDGKEPQDKVLEYLRAYHTPGGVESLVPKILSLDDCSAILRFDKIIDDFTHQFARNAQWCAVQDLRTLPGWRAGNDLHNQPRLGSYPISLSPSELRRIKRAFCRWQIHTRLFGARGITAGLPLGPDFQRAEYFGHYKAWEAEEIISVREFAARIYLERMDFARPSIPSYWPSNNWPGSSADHFVSLGPKFLADVLDSLEKLTMQKENSLPSVSFPRLHRQRLSSTPNNVPQQWESLETPEFAGDEGAATANWGWRTFTSASMRFQVILYIRGVGNKVTSCLTSKDSTYPELQTHLLCHTIKFV